MYKAHHTKLTIRAVTEDIAKACEVTRTLYNITATPLFGAIIIIAAEIELDVLTSIETAQKNDKYLHIPAGEEFNSFTLPANMDAVILLKKGYAEFIGAKNAEILDELAKNDNLTIERLINVEWIKS